jgi:hypothetical protein
MIPRSKALLSLASSLVLAPILAASSQVELSTAGAPEPAVQSGSTGPENAVIQVAEVRQDKDSGDSELTAANDPLPKRPPHAGIDENIFSGHAWYTPPPPPPKRIVPAPVAREPTAPPLPYTLLGSYAQAGSPTLYFLVKGERTYDVRIGDILDDTYSVDNVSNGQLMFT